MENYQNTIQDKRITKIETYTQTMNTELGVVKTDLAIVKNDVSWLKRNYWIVVGASLSTLIASLFKLLIK